MYGAVVGLYKAGCHSKAPKEEDFAKIIAKIYSITKPELTIVDGIVAMEGDGPAAGQTRSMNVVMAGTDAVAIDSSIAMLINLNPLDVLVTKEAYFMKLGEADPSRIEIVGDDVATFAMKDFKLPQTTILKFIPRAIANGVASIIRFKPFIDSSICTRCNLCKITCPVYAIEIDKKSCKIDYAKCVRCLCCQEVCPYKAISIKKNVFTRLVWG